MDQPIKYKYSILVYQELGWLGGMETTAFLK